MAQKRMFDKSILTSTRFLQMSLDLQMTYIHLALHADDDGIVEAFGVLKMIGAANDNIKILIAKKLVQVLDEENQIVYIVDWLIHNNIRNDRKKDSLYKELLEKAGFIALPQRQRAEYQVNRMVKQKISELPYSFNYKIRASFDGKECPICHRLMNRAYKTCRPTIQHNIPIKQGGKHELDNISVVCNHCNTSMRDHIVASELNNKEVKKEWLKIIDPFGLSNDRQMTVKRQLSIEENSIEENSIEGEIVKPEIVDLREIVKFYNEIFNKRIESTNGFKDNYLFWSKIHSKDKIKTAIQSAFIDRFWKDKMTLTILFRKKNPQGEKVDYIEDLSNRSNQRPSGGVAII